MCNSPQSFTLRHGSTNFPKIWEPPQSHWRQGGETRQVPYRGPTNVRPHRTKFSRHGNLPLAILHPCFRSMHYCITRKTCVVKTAVDAFLQAGPVFHSVFVWLQFKAGSHCGSPSSIRSESRMGIGYRDPGFSWFASVPRGKWLVNKLARATATSYRILWLGRITRGMHSGDTRFKSRPRTRYTDSPPGRSPQPLGVNIMITFQQASTASSHTPSGATFTHINKSHSKILLHKRSCWHQQSEITKSWVGPRFLCPVVWVI